LSASERKVRVGLVGIGRNGLAHARAHRELGRSEIVALCDRNPEALRAAGKRLGVERLYTGDDFYADPDIEAVSIHTGDPHHREPFLRAIEAGKHVLIEKPLANTEEDVHRMVAAARRAPAGLKIQVGYVLRFNPVFEAIQRAAREGRLGDIYYMEADYIHNLLVQAEQTDPHTGRNWYLEDELPMVGGGSHALDLLRWISGKEVVAVSAYARRAAFGAMRHEDCHVALYRFADGSIAKVAALYAPRRARPPWNNLCLYGTRGTVERNRIALSKDDADVHPAFRPVAAEALAGHPFHDEIADWLEAIVADRPTRIGLLDGANSTLATLCAVRAAREGTQVAVPVLERRRT